MTRQDILNLINNALLALDNDELCWTFDPIQPILSALEEANLIWTPENNTTQWRMLTPDQQEALKAAKHGWEFYTPYGKWADSRPTWHVGNIYRAKPAPVVKSVWTNVYFEADDFDNYSMRLSPAFSFRKTVDHIASEARIGVARFDLIDGVLSVELEPLDNKG